MKAKFSFKKAIEKFSSTFSEVHETLNSEIERCYICGEKDSVNNMSAVKIDPLDIYNTRYVFHEECMKSAILEPEKYTTRQVDKALECQQKLSQELRERKRQEEREQMRLEEERRREEEKERARQKKLEKAQEELLQEYR